MDVETFRLNGRLVETPTLRKRRLRGGFVKGPIPLAGVRIANSLGGKAGLVYLLVYYIAGLKRTTESLPITPTQAVKFGLTDRTVRRGLIALESAGLVSITREPNRSPRVTIEDPPVGDSP